MALRHRTALFTQVLANNLIFAVQNIRHTYWCWPSPCCEVSGRRFTLSYAWNSHPFLTFCVRWNRYSMYSDSLLLTALSRSFFWKASARTRDSDRQGMCVTISAGTELGMSNFGTATKKWCMATVYTYIYGQRRPILQRIYPPYRSWEKGWKVFIDPMCMLWIYGNLVIGDFVCIKEWRFNGWLCIFFSLDISLPIKHRNIYLNDETQSPHTISGNRNFLKV